MNKTIGLLFLVPFLLVSCATTKTERFVVASQQGDCVGVMMQKCMLVKKGADDKWTFFYDRIEGFQYEEGYEYVLEVKKEKKENVPADASSLKYILVKEKSKTRTESKGLPKPISYIPQYQWGARILEKSDESIGRGGAKGKMNVTVLTLLVTSSETMEFDAGDTIHCELVSVPKIVPLVGSEYVFKAKDMHPAHALGVYMLGTDLQDLTR